MFKLVLFALVALCALFVHALPADDLVNKKEETSNDESMKKNNTEKSADEAAVRPAMYYPMFYSTYNGHPVVAAPNHFQSVIPASAFQSVVPSFNTETQSVPNFVPTSYSFSSGEPFTISPSPAVNSPSSLFSRSQQQQLPQNEMHFNPKSYYGIRGGLRGPGSSYGYGYRPQYYGQSANMISQPQYYSLPSSSHSQQYSGYPSEYGNYGSYGYNSYFPRLYRRDAEESKLQNANMELQMHPSVQYHTRYTEYADQPQYPNDLMPHMNYMPQLATRDATTNNVMAVHVLPEQLNSIRKNDVVVDDKLNLNLGPTYLTDRLMSNPHWLTSMSNMRAETPEFNKLYNGNYVPEDEVYMEFTPSSMSYKPEQHLYGPSQPSYKTAEISTDYYPMAYNNVALNWNTPKGDNTVPYSPDQIKANMMQLWYNTIYAQNLADMQNNQKKDNSHFEEKVLKEMLKAYSSRAANDKNSKEDKKTDQKKEEKMKADDKTNNHS